MSDWPTRTASSIGPIACATTLENRSSYVPHTSAFSQLPFSKSRNVVIRRLPPAEATAEPPGVASPPIAGPRGPAAPEHERGRDLVGGPGPVGVEAAFERGPD